MIIKFNLHVYNKITDFKTDAILRDIKLYQKISYNIFEYDAIFRKNICSNFIAQNNLKMRYLSCTSQFIRKHLKIMINCSYYDVIGKFRLTKRHLRSQIQACMQS